MTSKNSEAAQAQTNGEASKNLAMQIIGVTKQFGSNVAVNNVSFDVRRGEVVGFLGTERVGQEHHHEAHHFLLHAPTVDVSSSRASTTSSTTKRPGR